MEQCIILAARRYDFKDDTGKHVEGITLTYITDFVEVEGDTRGCQPLSVTAPILVWSSLTQVPGVYDLDFRQRPGPKGKPTLQLCKLNFVAPVELLDALPKP